MRSTDGEGRSIRSDALYPALRGEWEVPVTSNAKITTVNEGGGVRGRGASPPGSPLAGSPVTRNAEIDPPPPRSDSGRGFNYPSRTSAVLQIRRIGNHQPTDFTGFAPLLSPPTAFGPDRAALQRRI